MGFSFYNVNAEVAINVALDVGMETAIDVV